MKYSTTGAAIVVVFGLLIGMVATMPTEPNVPQPIFQPIPATVPSIIGPTPVIIMANIDSVCEGTRVMGCFVGGQHAIYLRDSMALNVSWETLEHEKFHMIISDAGARHGSEDDVADAVGAYRVLEMLHP